MNITLNFNPADKADLAQAQLVLTALGCTPAAQTAKPDVKPVPKAAPAVPPKPTPAPVKDTPAPVKDTPPEEPQQPADQVNDQPLEAQMTQMRDLAKKLILKNRAALSTLFTKYKVKLLSEIKPADVPAVIAEIEAELL